MNLLVIYVGKKKNLIFTSHFTHTHTQFREIKDLSVKSKTLEFSEENVHEYVL